MEQAEWGKRHTAALSMRLALEGYKVAVITIDPAKRLADALGLEGLSNAPQPVNLSAIDPACSGRLDAMMLDMKSTFDSIIVRHFNEETRDSRRAATTALSPRSWLARTNTWPWSGSTNFTPTTTTTSWWSTLRPRKTRWTS